MKTKHSEEWVQHVQHLLSAGKQEACSSSSSSWTHLRTSLARCVSAPHVRGPSLRCLPGKLEKSFVSSAYSAHTRTHTYTHTHTHTHTHTYTHTCTRGKEEEAIGSEELMTEWAHCFLQDHVRQQHTHTHARAHTHTSTPTSVGRNQCVGLGRTFKWEPLFFCHLILLLSVFDLEVETCQDARVCTLQARALWHTLEQQTQLSAAQGQVPVFKSSRRGRRVTESAGKRCRCAKKTETNPRRHLDMAAVKTFELFVGVVLVCHCLGDARAEVPASDGKSPQPLGMSMSSGPIPKSWSPTRLQNMRQKTPPWHRWSERGAVVALHYIYHILMKLCKIRDREGGSLFDYLIFKRAKRTSWPTVFPFLSRSKPLLLSNYYITATRLN